MTLERAFTPTIPSFLLVTTFPGVDLFNHGGGGKFPAHLQTKTFEGPDKLKRVLNEISLAKKLSIKKNYDERYIILLTQNESTAYYSLKMLGLENEDLGGNFEIFVMTDYTGEQAEVPNTTVQNALNNSETFRIINVDFGVSITDNIPSIDTILSTTKFYIQRLI